MFVQRKKKNEGVNTYSEQIKEQSILKRFPKENTFADEKNFLYCDPPEVILQNIEKNKMYEVPVRIYNVSSHSKRINIKPPETNAFKVDYDRKNKNSQIAPGLFMEILIIFECENLNDYSDKISICSENDLRIPLYLKAYKPQPMVHFEPLINLGFVPVNTRKVELIEFANDGMVDTKIELKIDKNSELTLDIEKFDLLKNSKENKFARRRKVTVTFEPKDTNNLHEKIEVFQFIGEESLKIGVIEVIATSVYQQLSIVFEEGGGPSTEINFGMLYFGQSKECSAFLVNNGPRNIDYKFFFHPNKNREDVINHLDDSDFACTPEQAGIEMTQRILSAEPINGDISSYTQIPIKFICKTKIPEKQTGWRGHILEDYDKNGGNHLKIKGEINNPKLFKSTAAVKFEESSLYKSTAKESDEKIANPISVFMEVKAIYPDLTLDKTMLNFWECKLHENKIITLQLTNKNEELPVDFSFNKIPYFTVEPSKGIINPNSKFPPIKVYFHPENYGNFSDALILRYVNNMYEIPIRVIGICKDMGMKQKKMRGPEATEQDFKAKEAIVPDDVACDYTNVRKNKIDVDSKKKRLHDDRIKEMEKNKSNKEIIENFEIKYKTYEEIDQAKQKSNNYLSEFRNDRITKVNPKAKAMSRVLIDSNFNKNEIDKPTLLDVLMVDGQNRCDSPKLQIPEVKENLWVLKPIGKYEPESLYDNNDIGKDTMDPNKRPSEKLPNLVPTTHKEKKDCEMELDGFALQKVIVGTKESREIDFGDVFKNSEMYKTFWIRNNSRNHIFVQLDLERPELRRSYPKSMVITPGTQEGFNLVFFSGEVKRFTNIYIKYTINIKSIFNLKILANVTPVMLKQMTQISRFTFKNEKFDKVEMSVLQKLVLGNFGNAPAKIRWEENKVKYFSISPMEAVIMPGKEFPVEITFTPTDVSTKNDIEDELKLNIENGNPMMFRVIGNVPMSVVKFWPENSDTINCGFVHIGVGHKVVFTLKNSGRNIIAYMIQNPLQGILHFKEQTGYFETTRQIEMTIDSKEENPNFYQEVDILIRGGQKLTLKIKACIIQPNVFIAQENFDFGDVEFNEQIVKTMTFQNNSNLDAKVIVNLDNNILLRDFKLELCSKYKGEKGHLVKGPDKDQNEDLNNISDHLEEDDDDENELDESSNEIREFTITIPANSALEFDFIFCPNNATIKSYDFMTNFILAGVDECKGLQRKVSARIIDCVINVQKSVIDFGKTFIYGNDKNYVTQDNKISNLSNGKVKWWFDTRDIEKERVFQVLDKEGELSENTDATLCTVKFSFTPQQKKKYTNKIVLYTIDESGKQSTKTITLIGEGTLPRLYFDKRELILPVVPLNIESSIKFKIKNDGYENSKIYHKIDSQMGLLPIDVKFLDDHTIGYMKNELRMEISFKSAKPLSFTCKLIFFDDDNVESYIMVAGTTDNCIFTNFSFFQSNFENFEIVRELDSINVKKVKENDMDLDLNEDRKSVNFTVSHMSTIITKTSVLGYKKIRKEDMENNCKFLKRYIKIVYPNAIISQFPEDVVKDHGSLLYEIIHNLTGKYPPGRIIKYEEDLSKKASQLRQQYFDLIKYLQEQGAYLNTVFPEYLLDYTFYKKYLMNDPNTAKILEPNWDKNKRLIAQYQYMHKESWIILLYQILKIYYLSRVNLKTFPMSLKHLPDEVANRFGGVSAKIGTSNMYSSSELYLLRWLQANYEHINPSLPKLINNFSDDLKDTPFLSSLILAYFPKVEELHKLSKKKVNTEAKILSPNQILNILKEYGVYTHVKPKHLLFPSAREMILFLIMLYQNLQHFIPKQTIPFQCILGDTVTKAIYLENTSNSKRIEYLVKIEGCTDFYTQSFNEIKLEPGQNMEYPIYFKSRLSQQVEAKIYFINKNEGWSLQAAPLVYNLVSRVTGRRSIEPTKIVRASLYKKAELKFSVKSPFKERGDFEIRLYQQKKPQQPKKTNRLVKNLKVKDDKKEDLQYKVFFQKHDGDGEFKPTIKLDNDTAKEVTIYYLPIDMDIYECNVVFVNEKIGEFQYTIEGYPELPEYLDKFEKECYVDEGKEFELTLSTMNKYLQSALNQVKLDTTYMKKLANNSKKNASSATNLGDRLVFSVESTKPYFIVNPVISPQGDTVKELPSANNLNNMVNAKDSGLDKSRDQFNTSFANNNGNNANNNALNTSGMRQEVLLLKVKFISKVCQIYEGDIILRNLDKANDIRVFKLIVSVKPKNIYAKLEFNCPVKQQIRQIIPIHNASDKDWIIKGDLQQTHNFFQHEQDKKISKKSTGQYILLFNPTERVDSKGKLTLTNTFTKEIYEYELIGKVDDPLAEGTLEFSCNAKDTLKRKIVIENPNERDTNFIVETDLSDIISGPQSFTIKAGQVYNYEITVKPLLGKIYFGKITFIDDKKNYIWYTIKVEARSIFQQHNIEMRTCIRKAIYIEISLENPMNELIIFHIDYEGDFLLGDKEMRLEPNKNGIYQLFFAPLKVGAWDGKLHIFNEYVGEFLYKIKLVSEENPPIYPDILKAELGKSTEYAIPLENPINEEVDVLYQHTNKKLFTIIPDKITIPPYSTREVIVKYSPSTLDGEEECQLRFETSKIGKWVYNLRGKGVPPGVMETTVVSTYVDGITSGTINFNNRLNEKIQVTVELKCDEWPGTFELLNKKDKYIIEHFRNLLIPFTFSPRKLTKYYAEIIVYLSKSLFWRFPIEGVTEVKSKGIDHTFRTRAKKMFETKVNLDLSNLPDDNIENEEFTLDMKFKEEKYKSLIEKCLTVEIDKSRATPQNPNISSNSINKPNNLALNIKFYPLRPFKTECEFVISKKSGGQWIYNIILEATEPDPDDVIHIQSSLGKISHVSFKLQNIFTKNAKFVAYFSHDSTSEFSVSPREGLLDQSGREGTTFLVSYLPVEYGKVKIGKLIIETDEIQWIFEVRGTHLDYKPPEVKVSNLNKITKATASRIQTNDKTDNIRKKINEIKESQKKMKTRNKSRSRSRSKSP